MKIEIGMDDYADMVRRAKANALLQARLAEADSLLAIIRNNARMADLMAWGIADGIEVYFADRETGDE